MKYFFSTIFKKSFGQVITDVKEELKKEGFGVLTDIDVKATMKKKLDVELKNYRILGPVIQNLHIRHFKKKTRSGRCYPAM